MILKANQMKMSRKNKFLFRILIAVCAILLVACKLFVVEKEKYFKVEKSVRFNGYYIAYKYRCLNQPLRCDWEGLDHFPIDDSINRIALIEELLEFEGDARISIKDNGPCLISQLYFFDEPHSIQVEALYLINYILGTGFHICVPCFVNNYNDNEESIEGPMIDSVFYYYKEWFKKVKETGDIQKAREVYGHPLEGSNIRWYDKTN